MKDKGTGGFCLVFLRLVIMLLVTDKATFAMDFRFFPPIRCHHSGATPI